MRAAQRLSVKALSAPGEKQTIVFFPDINNDHTGIFLSNQRFYRFTIDGVKDWVDCTIEDTTPYEGRKTWISGGNIFINVLNYAVKPICYAPFSGYMELLGEAAGQQVLVGRLAKSGELFSPKTSGELILRVNEPRFLSTVYANNTGVLSLTIEAVK